MNKTVRTSLFAIFLITILFCFQSCKKSNNDTAKSLENISGIWKIIKNNDNIEKAPFDYVIVTKNTLTINSYTNKSGKLEIEDRMLFNVSDIHSNSFKIKLSEKYILDSVKKFEDLLKKIKDVNQIKKINEAINQIKKMGNITQSMTYKINGNKLSIKSEMEIEGKTNNNEIELEKTTKLPL